MANQKKLLLFPFLTFTFLFFFVCTFFSSGQAKNTTDFSILLAFKYSSDTSNSLSSWSNPNDSCSAWLGVVCHPITNRVTKLVLDSLNLTGSTHLLVELSELRHLSLHHNRLTRVPDFSSWSKLRHLYLSHNRFTGSFPAGVSALRNLRRLDLSYNYFSGEIPVAELSQLPHLLTLRLEFNGFNGSLGPVGSSLILTTLTDFNVSGNGLTGEIPSWLSRFPASSFVGNVHLCGKPLSLNCINGSTRGEIPLPIGVTETDIKDKNKKKSSRKKQILLIATIDAVGVLLMILAVGLCCYYKKIYNKNQEINKKVKKINNSIDKLYYGVQRGISSNDDGIMVRLEGCKGFNGVDDLLKASAEMLGKGSIGTTYKVVMDSGYVLMVKRIKERVKRGKVIDGFLRIIGGLRHTNVVSLRGYYSSKEEFLLVFDFLPNGSLHYLLHGNRGPGRTPLDWPTRLKYASESAKGLSYIHNHSNSKLFHGHFTSSNIIIDQNNNACISDIGIHHLLQVPISSNNGYTAPEPFNDNHKSTQMRDVYSFGVVLLEILTGKTARNEGDDDESSLVKWAQRVFGSENWKWDDFDFELMRNREMEEDMMAMLKVAMLCLASLPKDRPKMGVVCNMIEDIRNNN